MNRRFSELQARLLRDHFATQAEMAKVAGITSSVFGRGKNKGFGPEPLLRLALHVGMSPREILEAAGKKTLADLIEEAYGPEREPLSAIDRKLVELPVAKKRGVLALLDSAQEESPPGQTAVVGKETGSKRKVG